MDILKLIDELEEIIDDASSIPFTKKVGIDPEEVYELIHDLKDSLPEEMKEARWVNEERERILGEAQKQAEILIQNANEEVQKKDEDAKRRYKELVNEHAITVEAKRQAEQIIADAKSNSNTIIKNSLSYVDGMLVKTEDELKSLLSVISDSRGQLRK
ncbi:MAG: ATPase [Tissierellia bacterium]|nr:ATPase [Tissierellia bacterium]